MFPWTTPAAWTATSLLLTHKSASLSSLKKDWNSFFFFSFHHTWWSGDAKMSLSGSIFPENWTTKPANYGGKLHKLSLWWMRLAINGSRAGERGLILVLLWRAGEGRAFFMEEITISHNGENELPRSVWNKGWQKMLNSHKNNNAGINNLVHTDVRSHYWDNTHKTAQTSALASPILTYSSNDQKRTKTGASNGLCCMRPFPDL